MTMSVCRNLRPAPTAMCRTRSVDDSATENKMFLGLRELGNTTPSSESSPSPTPPDGASRSTPTGCCNRPRQCTQDCNHARSKEYICKKKKELEIERKCSTVAWCSMTSYVHFSTVMAPTEAFTRRNMLPDLICVQPILCSSEVILN